MLNNLDECIDIIKDMILEDKKVTFTTEKYVLFKEKITQYVYNNNLDETDEWKQISQNMIYTAGQYLSRNEANCILFNLEGLKRKHYKTQQEKELFKKLVHPLISKVSKDKFFDGYYADSVESAFKEINARCKKIYYKATQEEKDGADLMHNIFSENKPILKFEEKDNETSKNVQRGYMEIFAGAMTGIRNPKAHENQHLIKEKAFRRLILASLLMEKIDEAIEVKENWKSNT